MLTVRLEHRDRDFFKLSRINLRCDNSQKVVDPIVEESRKKEVKEEEAEVSMSLMEPSAIASRPADADLARPRIHDAAPTLPQPTTSSLKTSAHAIDNTSAIPSPRLPSIHYQHPSDHALSPRDAARHSTTLPPLASNVPQGYNNNPAYSGPPINGHARSNSRDAQTPSLAEVNAEALSRVQHQISYNTTAIDLRTKEIARVNETVERLQQDVADLAGLVHTLRRELHSRPAPAAAPCASDHALEVFAANLQDVARRVTDVEGIRNQFEIVKSRVHRIEQANHEVPSTATYSASPHVPSAPPVPHLQTSTSVPKIHAPIRTDLRPEIHSDVRSQQSPYNHTITPESAYLPEPSQQAAGWATVNSGMKRPLANGMDGHPTTPRYEDEAYKRQKLAPIESRYNLPDSLPPRSLERMDTEGSSDHHSRTGYESHPASGHPASGHPSHTPTTFQNTADADPDDSWRPESQRYVRTSPQSRGRGGSRGRSRKSFDAMELGTPEWEKPGWSASQQVGPDGYYQPYTPGGTKRGNLVRRGSGGGGPASTRPMDQIHMSPDAFYNQQGKKTRSKPIRNAEGILIRKDGRPDMRSQSSAANLRKVHARKEQEKAIESGQTPATESPMDAADTPTSFGEDGPMDRHEANMKRIFPHGIDGIRSRQEYEEGFFPSSSPDEAAGKARIARQEREQPEVSNDSAGAADGHQHHGKEKEKDAPMEDVIAETQVTSEQDAAPKASDTTATASATS